MKTVRLENWHYVPSEEDRFMPLGGYLFGHIGEKMHRIGPILGRTEDNLGVVDHEAVYELGAPMPELLSAVPDIKERVLKRFSVFNFPEVPPSAPAPGLGL